MQSYHVVRAMLVATILTLVVGNSKSSSDDSGEEPGGKDLAQSANGMIRSSQTTLAPVYAPLAEQIAEDLDLAAKEGIGIDLGGGPGNLIIELCKRTRLHWINADINPHFFAHFYACAAREQVAHRVSAMYADAQNLPFKDNYADIIVSRGSYHFWPDREAGLREILRVLKPGGVAYIGRGFARDLPLETARAIRSKQGKKMKYDVQEHAKSLRSIMKSLAIPDYRVETPKPLEAKTTHYGVWVLFRKPESQ